MCDCRTRDMHRCHDATSSTNRTPARARKHHRRHDSLAGVQAELDTARPHTAWPLLGGKPQLIARLRLAFGMLHVADATRQHFVGAQAGSIFASEFVKPRVIARTLHTMHAPLLTPNQRIWHKALRGPCRPAARPISTHQWKTNSLLSGLRRVGSTPSLRS